MPPQTSSIYEVELENGNKLYLNVAADFSEYWLYTFLICLELGKIVAINRPGFCLATISDGSLITNAEFHDLILSARNKSNFID